MRVSKTIQKLEGVEKVALMMATDNNKRLLGEIGLLTGEVKGATPNDLVIAVEADEKSWTTRCIKLTSF
jgi:hypothetical protein